jgi:hypothetical protein
MAGELVTRTDKVVAKLAKEAKKLRERAAHERYCYGASFKDTRTELREVREALKIMRQTGALGRAFLE